MKTVSMKPVVQKPRKDGFWAVYIRFTLDGRCQFWKTSKVVSSQNVKSKSEITDPHVLSFCSSLILQWMEKLNHVDYSAWNLKDIVEYVTNDDSQVSFSSYARTYIEKIDKPRTAKNNLLRGTAFYKGKVVAEEEKTGFTNKGQLVALLIKRLPRDIPTGAIVQFVMSSRRKK